MASTIEADAIGPEDEINAYDFICVIRKHWRLELGLVILACATVGAVSVLQPKLYDATASLLPPMEGQSIGMIDSLLGDTRTGTFLGSFLARGSGEKERQAFLGILKSRTMQDAAIEKFNLIEVYGYKERNAPWADAREKLSKMTEIDVSKEGVISVTISAYEPQMAAEMANFFVDNLDRLYTSLSVNDAKRNRLFLETRVAEAETALRGAEERLRDFQSSSRAIVLEGQTKAAIEGAATLEGQILAAEIQLRTLQTFSTEHNPDVIRLRESIQEMRRQLRRMEYGRGASGKASGGDHGRVSDFMVPLGSVPAKGLELVRLIREAKIQETIFTLLTQQLEQARIAEARDTPTIRVLDRAVIPEWHSRPKVFRNVMIGGAASLLAGILLAFLLEYMEGIRRREAERRASHSAS